MLVVRIRPLSKADCSELGLSAEQSATEEIIMWSGGAWISERLVGESYGGLVCGSVLRGSYSAVLCCWFMLIGGGFC